MAHLARALEEPLVFLYTTVWIIWRSSVMLTIRGCSISTVLGLSSLLWRLVAACRYVAFLSSMLQRDSTGGRVRSGGERGRGNIVDAVARLRRG